MDYSKETFVMLQARREELTAELKTKGISEQERLAIRRSIDATNKYITTLSCKLDDTPTKLDIRHSIDAISFNDVIKQTTALQDASKLADTPTSETPKPFSYRSTGSIGSAFATGGFGWIAATWYFMYPNYASWRHSKWKFSQEQIDSRRHWFRPRFPELAAPASMRLSGRVVGSVCGAITACLWFLKSRGRPPPPPTPPQHN